MIVSKLLLISLIYLVIVSPFSASFARIAMVFLIIVSEGIERILVHGFLHILFSFFGESVKLHRCIVVRLGDTAENSMRRRRNLKHLLHAD